MKLTSFLACALALAGTAQAQNVTLNATPTTAVGTATPSVTWITAPGASSCTASDGWAGAKAPAGTEQLPAIAATTTYTLTCIFPGTAAQPGSATVNWEAPATKRDGTPYDDPGSYRIDYGMTEALEQTTYVDSPHARSMRFDDLAHGRWYFAVRAVNAGGFESDRSNVASLIVGTAAVPEASAAASATVTITPPPVWRTIPVTTGANVTLGIAGPVTSSSSKTPFALVPIGREAGAIAGTWRGRTWCYVVVLDDERFGSTSSRIAAPCALSGG